MLYSPILSVFLPFLEPATGPLHLSHLPSGLFFPLYLGIAYPSFRCQLTAPPQGALLGCPDQIQALIPGSHRCPRTPPTSPQPISEAVIMYVLVCVSG